MPVGINKAALAKRPSAARSVLSPAVTRSMSIINMSLKRVDAICETMGMDLSELVKVLEADEQKVEQLSREREQELVADVCLLLVAYCVVNQWSVEDIVTRYDISHTECIRHLARLDRMKLIELLPGNRIKTLIAPNFTWQPNGPIERYFRSQVQSRFFDSSFSAEGELRLVKNGQVSRKAQLQLCERLTSVGHRFDEICRDERALPLDERLGTTMVLAIRRWQFAAFQKLERTGSAADC